MQLRRKTPAPQQRHVFFLCFDWRLSTFGLSNHLNFNSQERAVCFQRRLRSRNTKHEPSHVCQGPKSLARSRSLRTLTILQNLEEQKGENLHGNNSHFTKTAAEKSCDNNSLIDWFGHAPPCI
jgi:hypothetical protein